MTAALMKLLSPQQQLDSIYELDAKGLRSLGIRGIIFDMDNTLVPWNNRAVYPRLASWLARLDKKGFRLCIVSNNSRERGGQLALDLGFRRSGMRQTAPPLFRKALQILELPRKRRLWAIRSLPMYWAATAWTHHPRYPDQRRGSSGPHDSPVGTLNAEATAASG